MSARREGENVHRQREMLRFISASTLSGRGIETALAHGSRDPARSCRAAGATGAWIDLGNMATRLTGELFEASAAQG